MQKICDYRLHLAAATSYLDQHPPIAKADDLRHHRIIGYIPDMIFDSELDYLAELGLERVALGSNSVAVQFNFMRHGAGLGVVHDFALPSASGLVRILPHEFSLTRSFYLIRHLDDRRVSRLNRFAEALYRGIRKELVRLEALVDAVCVADPLPKDAL